MNDHDLAADLAAAAAELLRGLRATSGLAGRDLGDEGDRRAHQLLVERLAEERPDDAILSEEGRDDAARLGAERVWIVDPLDGTREYGEERVDWAVHWDGWWEVGFTR